MSTTAPPPIPTPVLNRVPGDLPRIKPDKYFEDLATLEKPRLLEIKAREEKILSNK